MVRGMELREGAKSLDGVAPNCSDLKETKNSGLSSLRE